MWQDELTHRRFTVHRLGGWGTVALVTAPSPSTLPVTPPPPAPALPTTTPVVVFLTTLEVMSLLVPVIMWWKVPIVVLGTKYWDGGYIVAHGVALPIILRPESLGPSSGQRLVDVVAFDVLGWITCWGHLSFIDSLAQQCLDAELSYLVVTVAALTVLISVLLAPVITVRLQQYLLNSACMDAVIHNHSAMDNMGIVSIYSHWENNCCWRNGDEHTFPSLRSSEELHI